MNGAGLDAAGYTLQHFRIDMAHSNAHTVWQSLESPQDPTEEQLAAIKDRQGLESLAEPQDVTPTDGTLALPVSLPLPSVSILVLTPR